ncbi:hypothetical protein ACFQZI_03330 [Mucilaginibacter lutimaris]|uniref:Glycoside hydrolase 123 C-terminal domain-containing protein n=1 Tax=Mucilaginibacter lutimaris TaxID=931629 RepID=A0ABW2ZC83_9SPHI
MVYKVKLACTFLLVLFSVAVRSAFAQNLALNKTYTVSKNSNYSLTSPDNNHTLLTDGNYTNGFFWKSNTTAGWEFTLRIYITIPLGDVSNIGKITFNTARGKSAGVEYPSHIFAFTSTDNINYQYQGDIAADPNNTSGDYAVRKFVLDNINAKAAYVKLAIVPNGSYVFCDEIEVIKGNKSNNANSKNVLATDIDRNVDVMVSTLSHINKLQTVANGNADRSGSVDEQLKQAQNKWAANQRNAFKNDIVVSKINPWDRVAVPYKPNNTTNYKYTIATTVNGKQYGAFVITNLANSKRVVKLAATSSSAAVSSTALYSVPYVMTGKNYDEIADPLINVKDTISLSPGESRVMFFKITGKAAGSALTNIKISSQAFALTLPVNVSVAGVVTPKKPLLNAVNWAYLNFPMLTDRREEAAADLISHDINTIVIPPNALPYVVNSDFTAYRAYLANVSAFSKLLIYINFPNKNNANGTTFMSADWKSKFITWYNSLVQNSKVAGFSESQIYLYPYDEVADKDLDDFYNFLTWLKSDHPSIKTYATIASTARWQKLGALLSIIQIRNTPAMIAAVKGSQKEIWMYDIKGFAETLSPYSYYRLMAWGAFLNDIKGIGFWNYADYRNNAGNKAFLTNFNGTNNTNYSVIYMGPGKSIISTRRWEAFSLGMDDYELLRFYAKKFGMAKAKALAATVLNNPDDYSKADKIRNQMIASLKR